MSDIKNPIVLYLKGMLMLLVVVRLLLHKRYQLVHAVALLAGELLQRHVAREAPAVRRYLLGRRRNRLLGLRRALGLRPGLSWFLLNRRCGFLDRNRDRGFQPRFDLAPAIALVVRLVQKYSS